MGPVDLGWESIAIAASLIVANGVISLALRLGLGRKLLIASVRTVVQLTLLGFILLPVFEAGSPWLVAGLALVMVAAAARASVGRIDRTYGGIAWHALIALSIGAGASLFAGVGLIVRPDPWWSPRYVLPLLGMILGNSLTGVTLGMDACLARLQDGRDVVDARLASGATAWEAALPEVRRALKTAMVPILNSMTIVGLVSIPGMMTGQLLGGTSPQLAARYQILIMFLIAAATALGATASTVLSARACFDDAHRLRAERITARG